MRNIRFQGKRVDNGKRVYGSLFALLDLAFILKEAEGERIHVIINTKFGDRAMEAIPVIPETVKQFTGLQDKNNIDIYEGDVVRVDGYDPRDIGIVTYHVSGFNVQDAHGSGHTSLNPCCEIIGNIYDNPKLLEKL